MWTLSSFASSLISPKFCCSPSIYRNKLRLSRRKTRSSCLLEICSISRLLSSFCIDNLLRNPPFRTMRTGLIPNKKTCGKTTSRITGFASLEFFSRKTVTQMVDSVSVTPPEFNCRGGLNQIEPRSFLRSCAERVYAAYTQ